MLGRSPATSQNPYRGSNDAYSQEYNTLVRPSAQYRQNEESRQARHAFYRNNVLAMGEIITLLMQTLV